MLCYIVAILFIFKSLSGLLDATKNHRQKLKYITVAIINQNYSKIYVNLQSMFTIDYDLTITQTDRRKGYADFSMDNKQTSQNASM